MPHDVGQGLLHAAVDGPTHLGGDVARLRQRQAHRQAGSSGAGDQDGHLLQPGRGLADRREDRFSISTRRHRARANRDRRPVDVLNALNALDALGVLDGGRRILIGPQDVDQGAHLIHSPAADLPDDRECGVGSARIGSQDRPGPGGLHADDRQGVSHQVVDVAGDALALLHHGQPALSVLLRPEDLSPFQGPLDALARPAPRGADERRHRDQRPPGDDRDDQTVDGTPCRLRINGLAGTARGRHQAGIDQGEQDEVPGPAHAALRSLGGEQAGYERQDRCIGEDSQVDGQRRSDDADGVGGGERMQAPQRNRRAAHDGDAVEDDYCRGPVGPFEPAESRRAERIRHGEEPQEDGEKDVRHVGPIPAVGQPPESPDGACHGRPAHSQTVSAAGWPVRHTQV